MFGRSVQAKVDTAIKHERRHGSFRAALRPNLLMHGRPPTEAEIEAFAGFVEQAVQAVPASINTAKTSAKGTTVQKPLRELIRRLEAYWYLERDLIPDKLGLIGILDDAYCSFCTLDNMSKTVAGQTGKALLAQDLLPTREVFRMVIGEPVASQLDQLVLREMRFNPWELWLQTLIGAMAQNAGATPMFGQMSTSAMAAHQHKVIAAGMVPKWQR